MVVAFRFFHSALSHRLASFLPVVSEHVARLFIHSSTGISKLEKRDDDYDLPPPTHVLFWFLIPVLVLLSGVFAGLTLGYMSLDETQLNVLSVSGTPKQRKYAQKIVPIRRNGHLLLVTLLLANMITNETLPIIADPVLGGGFQSIVFSTVLLVIFAEIIPQSACTRHGLYIGAKMADFTQILIYVLAIVAWPVAKVLEFVLGPHHGIVYRRAELKELIGMHCVHGTHGGDLTSDTVSVVQATIDLQGKAVKQAMTPISSVYMLSVESKLDYALLKEISRSGRSRIPVYEEVDIPVSLGHVKHVRTQRVKRILGVLLAKQFISVDPRDEIQLRDLPLHNASFVPNNEPLLAMIDKFQRERSHLAFVSRLSAEKPLRPRKLVRHGLARRLRERVGLSDYEKVETFEDMPDCESTLQGDSSWDMTGGDVEMGLLGEGSSEHLDGMESGHGVRKKPGSTTSSPILDQSVPSEVSSKEGNGEFVQNLDPAVMPLGIITLEDVLEHFDRRRDS